MACNTDVIDKLMSSGRCARLSAQPPVHRNSTIHAHSPDVVHVTFNKGLMQSIPNVPFMHLFTVNIDGVDTTPVAGSFSSNPRAIMLTMSVAFDPTSVVTWHYNKPPEPLEGEEDVVRIIAINPPSVELEGAVEYEVINFSVLETP